MTAFQRATAWVDTAAVERNCARLASSLTEGSRLCAVVKADGYGHGMKEVAAAAVSGGASALAVAAATEAFELRAAQPRIPILTMGALTEPELDVVLGARSDLALWDEGFVDTVIARAEQFGARPGIHVKYDTGMGRLGNKDEASVERLLERVASEPALELIGLWTHFATADEPDSTFYEEQRDRFLEFALPARERFGVHLHIANSAATLRDRSAHLDMVRCGVAIYGLDPFGSDPAEQDLEPALRLESCLAAIKRFEPGESAGYGRRWQASEPTWVGVVPVGYGDGVRRALTNNCEVLVGGERRPLVGTVSMDNITVDLGPETGASVGDPVVLIGAQGEERVLAEEWAERLETINYEVTCGISARVPRLRPR